MAGTIIGATALTLTDWATRHQSDGKLSVIVELLSQANEILDDMLWVEGNEVTGHTTTVRTGLPSATWRLLNYGVQPTKSTTAKIKDTCGMLETYIEIDTALAKLNGNTAEFRLSEAQAFMEGIGQQLAGALFYGNQATNPERITGLAPRYATVVQATAQSAQNVIDGLGQNSNNTSIWLCVWGPMTGHGIFPKGSKAGLEHRDLGEWTKTLTDGSMLQVWRDHFKWDCGLTVRDWRFFVRIANIDVTLLNSANAVNLVNLLIRAVNRVPALPRRVMGTNGSDSPRVTANMGKAAFYCNRTIRTYLDIQAVNKNNVLLRIEEWEGMTVTTFRGIPIRTCDQILNTEARVV